MHLIHNIFLRYIPLVKHNLGKLFLIQIAVNIIWNIAAFSRNENWTTRYFVIVVKIIQDCVDCFLGFAESEIYIRVYVVYPAWFYGFGQDLEHWVIDFVCCLTVLSADP